MEIEGTFVGTLGGLEAGKRRFHAGFMMVRTRVRIPYALPNSS